MEAEEQSSELFCVIISPSPVSGIFRASGEMVKNLADSSSYSTLNQACSPSWQTTNPPWGEWYLESLDDEDVLPNILEEDPYLRIFGRFSYPF